VILVVEDDAPVAQLIAKILQRHGFESEIVADGQSALDKARELHPSMILADLTIRGMGGQALCSAIKSVAETRDIPYVVVSGDAEIARKASECGADGYMGKPFEFDELIRVVRQYARAES
jgi:CheY-like chemotaxis protein